MDAIGEIDFDPREQLEKFYDSLETMGVEIVEDFEDIPLDDIEIAVTGSASAQEEAGAENIAIDDPVKVYLKEIGRVPLLTPEEEIDLAIRISEGDAMAKKRQVLFGFYRVSLLTLAIRDFPVLRSVTYC